MAAKRKRLLILGYFAVLAALLGGAWLLSPPRESPEDEEYRPKRGLDMPQPATTEPPVKSAADVADALEPDELVLGVTVGGQSRAYPLAMLNAQPRYKVVNDRLGGKAIAATWCNYCSNGIVYDRVVDGKELVLMVFGQLWKGSMVIGDVETFSQWSQLLGEAQTGKMKGKKLTPLPSVVTDWQTWRREHPDTTVVVFPRVHKDFRRELFEKGDQFVLGIAGDGPAKAWRLDRLMRNPAANDQWNGRPVLAVLDQASLAARLYERTLGDQVLTFRLNDEHLTDEQTGSVWQPVTGKAVQGPLTGKELIALPACVADREVWLKFHPRSD